MRPGALPLTEAERRQRKRWLAATVVTCLAAAMIFGTLHVVKLGARRMDEMRAKATYDLAEEHKHIRAAGEDIFLHRKHEEKAKAERTYALAEVEGLLPAERWAQLREEVYIPPGPFTMGTDSPRADEQDQPAHTVTLPGYYIDKYPVTNAEYARFVAATRHRPPLDWEQGRAPAGKLLHPVTMVSWYDARDYCAWEGKRLPTEAEWEKAARGTDGRRWPWGNRMDPSRLNTYYNVGATTAVDRYPQGASPYGVMDLAGNVSEWTASDFAPYAGSKAPAELFQPKVTAVTSPEDARLKVADLVPVEGAVYKVRRGGSWKSDPFSTSAYHRNFSMPYYASDFFGFRCARSG